MVENSSNNNTKETTDNRLGKLDVSLLPAGSASRVVDLDWTPVHAKTDDLLQGTSLITSAAFQPLLPKMVIRDITLVGGGYRGIPVVTPTGLRDDMTFYS